MVQLQALVGYLRWPVSIAGGLSALILALLYAFQGKIIYVPRIPGVPGGYVARPEEYNLDHEDVWLRTADGVRLHAWVVFRKGLKAEEARALPLVVFLQENAGNMSMRLHFLRALVLILNCKCVILQYRGYGESEGTPSERGLQRDVDALMKYVVSREDYVKERTVLFGRSLGGAVAMYAAVEHATCYQAVIVENTFTSIEDMAGVAFPPLRALVGQGKRFNWLVRDKWRSLDRVGKLADVPVLFLVSMADEIVHPGQMARLYETGGGDANVRWRMREFDEAGHMDAYHTHAGLYWPEVKGFFGEYVQ